MALEHYRRRHELIYAMCMAGGGRLAIITLPQGAAYTFFKHTCAPALSVEVTNHSD